MSRKTKRKKKKQNREKVRVLLLLWGFFVVVFFKIRKRFVGRMGDVREVGRIEIEGNGEDRN